MVRLKNLQKKEKISLPRLKVLAGKTLERLGQKKAEVSVLLVDDETIQGLNREYLGRDNPTDVLAFPMREGRFPAINPDILGDVVISADTARANAIRLKTDFDFEICLYLVHGILHLLGYKDNTVKEKKEMERLQREIVTDYA